MDTSVSLSTQSPRSIMSVLDGTNWWRSSLIIGVSCASDNTDMIITKARESGQNENWGVMVTALAGYHDHNIYKLYYHSHGYSLDW